MSRMRLYKAPKRNCVPIVKDNDVIFDTRSDTSLSDVILNDLLYGVGNRPSLPSCFEDEEELNQQGVDPLSDMRHDSWHDASVAMNPDNNIIKKTSVVVDSDDDPAPSDPPKDKDE